MEAHTSEIAHVPAELRAVAHRLLALSEEAGQVSVPIAGQLSIAEHAELRVLAARLERLVGGGDTVDESVAQFQQALGLLASATPAYPDTRIGEAVAILEAVVAGASESQD